MKIGLLFGSFNPLHIGHLTIANYMAEFTDLQQVWLVVSPCNPLKKKKSLSEARKRLEQVKKAIGRQKKIKVSDIEFSFPLIKGGQRGISTTQPSYTINTLELLKKKYPRHSFTLIIGSDNLKIFHKWKDYKKILNEHRIFVYPRLSPFNKGGLRGISIGGVLKEHHNVKMIDAPLLDISSTFIREQIKKGKDMRHFVASR